MNPEEFRTFLNQIVENRDNQAKVTELATKLGDAFTETHTNFSSFKTDAEKKDLQIKDLQATNMNLFLRVGQQTPPDVQGKLGGTQPMTYDDLLKNWE